MKKNIVPNGKKRLWDGFPSPEEGRGFECPVIIQSLKTGHEGMKNAVEND